MKPNQLMMPVVLKDPLPVTTMPLLYALISHLFGPQIDYSQLLKLSEFLCLSLGTRVMSRTTMYISQVLDSMAQALRQSNRILPSRSMHVAMELERIQKVWRNSQAGAESSLPSL